MIMVAKEEDNDMPEKVRKKRSEVAGQATKCVQYYAGPDLCVVSKVASASYRVRGIKMSVLR